jgi:hypothetical protein
MLQLTVSMRPSAIGRPIRPTEYINMNSQATRKIIVAGAMAAVVGIGVATFALRTHPAAVVAQPDQQLAPVAQTPAAARAATEIPAEPPAAAPSPDTPAAVAQIPDATGAAVAHNDSVGTKSTDTATPPAIEHKAARKQRLAKADTSAVPTDGTATPNGSAVDTNQKPAAEPVSTSVDRVKSADELTSPPPASSAPTDGQKTGTSTEFPASDSEPPPK